jgi:hypothetical protein
LALITGKFAKSEKSEKFAVWGKMWRTHKKSVWVLCGWYAVYLGLAAVAVFFGWSDKPEMRKYCLIFLGVSVPGVVMSFFIESYRALFIAAGLGRLSIAIELCSFGVCFVCIWFTAFYMGYGFYGIKFSNTVVHVFSLGCYMSFWYKSEFFEAWRAGEKNSSAQEIPMGQGNADSSIYITNKFKPRVWPGPDPSEYFFVILIKKKTKQDPQLQKPNSRAPPGRAAPTLSTLSGYFKFSSFFILLTSTRTLWFDLSNLLLSSASSTSSTAAQSTIIALFIASNYFFSGYSISITSSLSISPSLPLPNLQASKLRALYALL